MALSFLAGGARRVVGIDGSPSLLRRAQRRIRRDPQLRAAEADGRLELLEADVTRFGATRRFGLVVIAGVLPHLGSPTAVLRCLIHARRRLTRAGRVIVDDLGPGQLPVRDLPLTLDWRRRLRGRDVVRYSQLMRERSEDGLRVAFSTLVERPQPDGTIARLPASYRLWYPSSDALERLVRQAGLRIELTYGSHDLEPLRRDSERFILVATRATGDESERLGSSRVVARQA